MISLLPSEKLKRENLPLCAAGEILYIPHLVDGHAVCLRCLPLQRVMQNMFNCVPSNIWCCIYDYFIFLLYISTYMYILIVVLNKCNVNALVFDVVVCGLSRNSLSN